MAQRYGGEFSPAGKPSPTNGSPPRSPFDGKSPTPMGARVNALFLVPLPLAVMAFFRGPTDLVLSLGGVALMMAAAWMTREGMRAEAAYESRKIARRPGLPRKIVGAVLMGAGIGLAGLVDGSLLIATLLGGVGAALHLGAFGIDPMRDKGMEGIDTFQTDRVARAVNEAEAHLTAMKDAIKRARDRQLEARVDVFQATARDMFRTIEDDPRDLTAARKYLGVYLRGATDATVKFADLFARSRDAGARADYEQLLDDLEANFAARTQQLLSDNRTDLDVEIEVLRERLAREGITSD
ncbi:5-bromo-4-chloroindolyl phosphate hydrolysis family protein [Aliiroseovarius sp.]|uniref:5-bromo-4-chloroindolyl phosphate hydrolysis family protein n=1 Tax=Aliiroseovarius sp. TaxID=1872442 RepID=UPI00263518A4|nr:5-bromo-4-chloroindolyl phosphate hydrolysis family protein [Aliiroseovarius sp.]